MITALALLLEAFAIAACGRGDRPRAASLLFGASLLGASASPLRGAYHHFGPLHWITLALCATLLVAETPRDDERGAPRLPIFIASLSIASASAHWLPFTLSMGLLCVLVARDVALAVGGFSACCLVGAAVLFVGATGSGAFSSSSSGNAPSAALLVGSLASTTAAALALWGGALRWAYVHATFGATSPSNRAPHDGAPLRSLTTLAWGGVLVSCGPLVQGFSGAEWRQASGGWQAAFGILGGVACAWACVRLLSAIRRAAPLEEAARLLVVVQLASSCAAFAGAGGASQTAAVTGVVFALASYFLFRASPAGTWSRNVALWMLGGLPLTCVFWARAHGLAGVAQQSTIGLLGLLLLTEVLAMLLTIQAWLAHRSPPPTAPIGLGLRVVAVALVVASLLPGQVPSIATLPY